MPRTRTLGAKKIKKDINVFGKKVQFLSDNDQNGRFPEFFNSLRLVYQCFINVPEL